MYNMGVVGRTDQVSEQFFAISPERRLKHPSVVLIAETARSDVFPEGQGASGRRARAAN